jgi:hypothetical protein
MAMRHVKDPDFAHSFEALPKPVQKLALKNFALLENSPRHPSLRFKRIHGDLWSIRVGQKYRALAVDEADRFRWFWIGTHSEYDRLVANA